MGLIPQLRICGSKDAFESAQYALITLHVCRVVQMESAAAMH